jgi:hypothetical protein
VERIKSEQQALLINELKQKVEARDSELALTKAKADRSAREGAEKASAAVKASDIARQRAVQATGNNARWYGMPVSERMKRQGFAQEIQQADIAEAATLFGPKPDSRAATEVFRFNPQRYAFLRALYRESSGF